MRVGSFHVHVQRHCRFLSNFPLTFSPVSRRPFPYLHLHWLHPSDFTRVILVRAQGPEHNGLCVGAARNRNGFIFLGFVKLKLARFRRRQACLRRLLTHHNLTSYKTE